MSSNSRQRINGFSLIELVIVITILGVLGAILSTVVVQPFQAAEDQTERARLVDQADLIISRIRREVRTAVPNSVRADSSNAVEFVPTITGGRYRGDGDGGGSDKLDHSGPSDTFDILGQLPDFAVVADNTGSAGSAGVDCADGDGEVCMNIFNTGQKNFNVYAQDSIAKITDTPGEGTDPLDDDQITYDNAGVNDTAFNRAPKRTRRFVVFDDVVSFVCDGDTLWRFSSYGLDTDQNTAPVHFSSGTAQNRVADDLTDCGFEYDEGTPTSQGLLKIRIELTRNNETVELFGQVHVVNPP